MPVGAQVGNYEIRRYVADGGFSRVFEARCNKYGEIVALKILTRAHR